MGTIAELGGHTLRSKNQTQFLGQDEGHNPLLELARGVEGNAATSQGRADALFGGGGGMFVPVAGGSLQRRNFTTPTTVPSGTLTQPGPGPTGGPGYDPGPGGKPAAATPTGYSFFAPKANPDEVA